MKIFKKNGKLRKPFKDKWLAALRSGEYEQGTGLLLQDNKYCCLGVACSVAGMSDEEINDNGEVWGLPEGQIHGWELVQLSEVEVRAALSRNLPSLNDHDVSFTEIADIIEEQL